MVPLSVSLSPFLPPFFYDFMFHVYGVLGFSKVARITKEARERERKAEEAEANAGKKKNKKAKKREAEQEANRSGGKSSRSKLGGSRLVWFGLVDLK